MIVTVFGDVHGNLVALEQLFEIEKSETDLFISHGDIVNYGPWSNECVSFLDTISNVKKLKGNHEHSFINGFYDGKNEVAQSFFDFCYKKFDLNLISLIENYENQMSIPEFTIQHTIGNQYIFADTNISGITIDSNYIIGHSHQQFEREKEGFKIYNTGSLGQNREFINLSCYVKVDTEKKTVMLKSFVHNMNYVINQMQSDDYPQICIDYYKSKKQV